MKFLKNAFLTLTFVTHGAIYAQDSSFVDGIEVPHDVVIETVGQNSKLSRASHIEVVSVKPLLFGSMFADWVRLKAAISVFHEETELLWECSLYVNSIEETAVSSATLGKCSLKGVLTLD